MFVHCPVHQVHRNQLFGSAHGIGSLFRTCLPGLHHNCSKGMPIVLVRLLCYPVRYQYHRVYSLANCRGFWEAWLTTCVHYYQRLDKSIAPLRSVALHGLKKEKFLRKFPELACLALEMGLRPLELINTTLKTRERP